MRIEARYPDTCLRCDEAITAGEAIEWEKGVGAMHSRCVPEAPRANPADVAKLAAVRERMAASAAERKRIAKARADKKARKEVS